MIPDSPDCVTLGVSQCQVEYFMLHQQMQYQMKGILMPEMEGWIDNFVLALNMMIRKEITPPELMDLYMSAPSMTAPDGLHRNSGMSHRGTQ